MASWKQNKVVGIVAGVVIILSIIALVMLLGPRRIPPAEEYIESPADTPFIKE